jgi:glycosyltransferase involved in cell wall biosynthesis
MLKVGLDNTYYVIPNIVDTKTFNISKKPPLGQIRFIHISSPDNGRKNIEGIIRAYKIVSESVSNARLTLVVGEGQEVEKLKQLSVSLGLKDSVHFLNSKPKNELAELMHDSTAFILFSSIETQAVVLLEAMCCGIPVISSRCSGPEEYITSKNGLLVDVGNENQLAEAMQLMVKNRNTYNASDIRNSVIDMVSEESVAAKFVQVYKNVLKLN